MLLLDRYIISLISGRADDEPCVTSVVLPIIPHVLGKFCRREAPRREEARQTDTER